MSIAKNTAHFSGMDASLEDRMQKCNEAGLTATKEQLANNTFLVNWDNDGVLCIKWLHDVLRSSGEIIRGQDSVNPVVGVQWQNNHLGTCGKIGCPWSVFAKVGGYDESMLGMSCQDVDLVRRLNLVGVVRLVNAQTSFTVSNREGESSRLMGLPAKQKRKEAAEETACKMANLGPRERALGSYDKISTHNKKIMQARLKKQQWRVNEGKQPGENTVRYVIVPRITNELEVATWDTQCLTGNVIGYIKEAGVTAEVAPSPSPAKKAAQSPVPGLAPKTGWAGAPKKAGPSPPPFPPPGRAQKNPARSLTPVPKKEELKGPTPVPKLMPKLKKQRHSPSDSGPTPAPRRTVKDKIGEPKHSPSGAQGAEAGLTAQVPIAYRHQLLIVSLGTKTIPQVISSSNARQLRAEFWHDKYTKQRGRKLGEKPEDFIKVRGILSEYFEHEVPDCRLDFVDCTGFHKSRGMPEGHVGLHPDIQAGYMRQRHAMTAMRRRLVDLNLLDQPEPGYHWAPAETLQRILVFWCNAGEHRSVAFATMVGDFMYNHMAARALTGETNNSSTPFGNEFLKTGAHFRR